MKHYPEICAKFFMCRFFPGIFLYCVVGALINKGAGKTGKDMIPNSKFWSDLPGLISVRLLFAKLLFRLTKMETHLQVMFVILITINLWSKLINRNHQMG